MTSQEQWTLVIHSQGQPTTCCICGQGCIKAGYGISSKILQGTDLDRLEIYLDHWKRFPRPLSYFLYDINQYLCQNCMTQNMEQLCQLLNSP